MAKMKSTLVFILLVTNFWAQAQDHPTGTTITAGDKAVPIYDFATLEDVMNNRGDSTYIINFWATWCIPCVQELPHFEELLAKYKSDKIRILLVSLDFPNKLDKSLIPFLQKNKLQADVALLDDQDANTWINKVDPSWSGALPATLILNKTQRLFFEKSFNFEELEKAYLSTKK